jgi:hypothetical protein
MVSPRRRSRVWVWASTACVILTLPRNSGAIVQWSGNLLNEYSVSDNVADQTYLLQTYLDITARPPKKRLLDTRLSVRLEYFDADGDTGVNASPLGNLGFRIGAPGFQFEVQQYRSANLTTLGQLVDTRTRRSSLGISPANWPQLYASFTEYETNIGSNVDRKSTALSVNVDHSFGSLQLHGGFFRQVRDPGTISESGSNNVQLGATLRHYLGAATQLNLAVDFDHNNSDNSGTGNNIYNLRTVRVGMNSRPQEWLSLDFNGLDEKTATSESAGISYVTRNLDLTGSLYPWASTRFYSTLGNRSVSDQFSRRDVDFTIIGSTWNKDLTPTASMTLSGSHTNERDPERGDNQRDYAAINSNLYVSPRARARVTLSVTHNSAPGFIDPERYDGSGVLADRTVYDDRFSGFTYYATDLGQVFTKLSSALGDWSEGVFVEVPTIAQYRNNGTAQFDLEPFQKSRLSVLYSIDTQSDRLELGGAASQTWSGSMNYQATRRTGFTVTGVRTSSSFGTSQSSWTGTMTTNTLRRHRVSLSYGTRVTAGENNDQASLTLTLLLPRGSQLDIIGSLREPFTPRAENFWRARYVNSF